MTTEARTQHVHGEAFRLMTYRADDGSESEVIWNSRDGVTPFIITLRSGKQATHVGPWKSDPYRPDYSPPPGSRMFVDLTPERAREHQRANAERYFAMDDEYAVMVREQFGTVDAMAEALSRDVQPGEPDLIAVPVPVVTEPATTLPEQDGARAAIKAAITKHAHAVSGTDAAP